MTPLPKLILFDLDGTLIDSAPDLHEAVNATLAEFGREPVTIETVRTMVGDGAQVLVERAFAIRLGPEYDPAAAFERFLAIYQDRATVLTRLYPGVAEALASFAEWGVAMALCTNKREALSRQIVDALGVGGHFSRVMGGDSLSSKKPDPLMLTTLADAYGVAPGETLMVGDSEVDAEAARAAGIPFVLMTYGYRRGPVEMIRCLAALTRFDALPVLLERLGAP